MFLRELFEAPTKKAVLAFGRLNPPTIGHAKLVDAITSQDGDHYLFLSQTQKPKTDPLDFATKMKLAKQFFPGINIGHQAVRTPVQALEKLQSLGYTDVVFIAGSDRVDGFQKLFDTYNGQPDKSGNVPFKFNSIKVVSAGERDPDADGAEGMSASKMRAAAAAGDLDSFAQGAPDKKLAKPMYDAVRKGMGVTEPATTERELSKGEEKEKERIVKGMKKGKAGFKKRYGKDADAVMYATATKMAKNESDLVLDKSALVNHLQKEIERFAREEDDIEKLSFILKQLSGKKIKARNQKYFTISDEDIQEVLRRVANGH